MELVQTYKFSEEQMRELYANTHLINEQTKLLEAFIKAQEGKANTEAEANETLSLLENNIVQLQGQLLQMKSQVEKWNAAMEKAVVRVPKIDEKEEALTLRQFFTNVQAVKDNKEIQRLVHKFHTSNYQAKDKDKIKPLEKAKTNNGRMANLYSVKELNSYVKGE